MQYTDKQIEEAVAKHIKGAYGMEDSDLLKLAMRMFREELANRMEVHLEGAHQVTGNKSLNPLSEFWKGLEEAPKETRFGGMDVGNGPLTVEKQDQGWQPIETAPFQKMVLVLFKSGYVQNASKHAVYVVDGNPISVRWIDYRGWSLDFPELTHWMPIPPLPEDK